MMASLLSLGPFQLFGALFGSSSTLPTETYEVVHRLPEAAGESITVGQLTITALPPLPKPVVIKEAEVPKPSLAGRKWTVDSNATIEHSAPSKSLESTLFKRSEAIPIAKSTLKHRWTAHKPRRWTAEPSSL